MKVVLASPIADNAVEALRRDHDLVVAFGESGNLSGLISDREVLIFRSGIDISADLLKSAPHLQLAIRAGSGFDNIALDFCRDRGIRVARIPGPSSQAVAEFTLGLILSLSRRIAEAHDHMQQGEWPKHRLEGRLIAGKVLGVVGAGNIGKRVGEMGALLGMRVVGCVEGSPEEHELVLAAKGITLTDFDTVVDQADILSVHVPLKDSTRHLIDSDVIHRLKPGSILVNTARGGVVDESAVLDGLKSGHLGAVALDVHEQEGDGRLSPLAGLPNVVLTPHIGGMAAESQEMIGRRVIELIDAFLQGRLEEVWTSDERLA
jgi:D-3-phosphoglycerate dehydrogenase / 2-oxoglutarate reductase